MFSNLTMKQKLITGGILAIMLLVIAFYGYTKLNEGGEEELTIDSQNFLETNEIQSNTAIETSQEVAEEKIVIHITGQVNQSGILELPVGSRIADAISLAGGETEKADLNHVNLAYELQDGQKIYIPSIEEKNEEIEYITSGSGNNVIVEESHQQGVSQKVNINQAGQAELEELPGIGPSLASQILAYRNANGNFKQIEDLQNVKGIGEAKFNNIKEYVTVK